MYWGSKTHQVCERRGERGLLGRCMQQRRRGWRLGRRVQDIDGNSVRRFLPGFFLRYDRLCSGGFWDCRGCMRRPRKLDLVLLVYRNQPGV